VSLKSKLAEHRRAARTGAAITSIVGAILLLVYPERGFLRGLSFDLPFLFAPEEEINDIVIIKMDNDAHRELHQEHGKAWDRTLHARLLKRLSAENAKMAVFDVFLADPTSRVEGQIAEEDRSFINSIRVFTNVVLAAVPKPFARLDFVPSSGYRAKDPIPPAGIFLEGARNQCGVGAVFRDDDGFVRQHYPQRKNRLSLPWVAAALYRPSITNSPTLRSKSPWIRFYPNLPTLSYHEAFLNEKTPPGYFKDKVVFIGGQAETDFPGAPADGYSTPLSRWSGNPTVGVEIHAATFLNLIHDQWINRMTPLTESAVVIIAGLLLGAGFSLLHPAPGAIVLAITIFAVTVGGICSLWILRLWFDWALIAFVQVPVAWISSSVLYTGNLLREKEIAEKTLKTLTSMREHPPSNQIRVIEPVNSGEVDVIAELKKADFDALKQIGEGAFGEVWLARTLTGGYRAIKVIHRRNFAESRPFEREFEGVKTFEKICRSHPGWVNIFYVGKNDSAGFFFYAMEPADDLEAGPVIEPEKYVPKTLGKVLVEKDWLPLNECIRIGIALADALEALHARELIHRDVKPSNIIFVNDAPKLADIGLVCEFDKSGTFIGTPDYIPPEGPGSVRADIFALGRVLYQMATGGAPVRHPELPTSLGQRTDTRELMRLMEVINRACAPEEKRYQSAADLRDDLTLLEASSRRRRSKWFGARRTNSESEQS
jgi:CHASE2 domain-containing sensor protein